MKKYLYIILIYLISADFIFCQNIEKHKKDLHEKAELRKNTLIFLKNCKYNDYLKEIEHYLNPEKDQTEELDNIKENLNNNGHYDLFSKLEDKKSKEILKIVSKPYAYNLLLLISNLYAQKGDFESSIFYLNKYKEIIKIKERYFNEEIKLGKEIEMFLKKFGEDVQLEIDRKNYRVSRSSYDFYKNNGDFDIKYPISDFHKLYITCKENIALNMLLKKDMDILKICENIPIESQTYYCAIAYKIFNMAIPPRKKEKEKNGYKSLLLDWSENKIGSDEIKECLKDLPILNKIIQDIIKK